MLMAPVAAQVRLNSQPGVSLGTIDENSTILIARKRWIEWNWAQGLCPKFPFFPFFRAGTVFSIFQKWKSSRLNRLKANNTKAGVIKSDIKTKLGYLNVIFGSICENIVCTSLKITKILLPNIFLALTGDFFVVPGCNNLGFLSNLGCDWSR